jgi:hypothetical protein
MFSRVFFCLQLLRKTKSASLHLPKIFFNGESLWQIAANCNEGIAIHLPRIEKIGDCLCAIEQLVNHSGDVFAGWWYLRINKRYMFYVLKKPWYIALILINKQGA